MADLVTEMAMLKHPFRLGVKAQIGVEFSSNCGESADKHEASPPFTVLPFFVAALAALDLDPSSCGKYFGKFAVEVLRQDQATARSRCDLITK